MDRRLFLAGLAAAPVLASAAKRDLIKEENAKPGTTDWQLTYVKADPRSESGWGKWPVRSPLIEGFADRTSVRAGERIGLFVSVAKKAAVNIDVYRMGWYGGKGGRHLARLGPFDAKPQPVPEEGKLRLRECAWERTHELEIPKDWPSGVYLGKLSTPAHRYQSYIVFIVRDDRKARYLFQCSDNTWQAYNAWPDKFSLYHNERKDKLVLVSGVQVSRDRPYGRYIQIMDNPLTQGSGEFLLWEYPLCYWMESLGLDVTYCSNQDVHDDAKCVTRCGAFLSVGHDEYWSREQFDHVSAAVKGGTHAAFLSANSCCFVTPLTPSSKGVAGRVLERKGRFGGIRASEKGYMADLPLEAPNEATLIGAQTITPFNGSGDWVCSLPRHWLFKGTGMRKGDAIPGLVGWEFHGDPAKIDGLEVVSEGETINGGDVKARYAATVHAGPKGNVVFNASTIFWSQGLASPPGHMPPISHHGRPHGPDERVQRMTRNVLERMG
ncbi:MAG: hypothetical protein K2W96_02355 [Gemmataceae bacterium]|nr:hypothetical protein [Gemmataceae bacterium]